jgi:GxxExxY protein
MLSRDITEKILASFYEVYNTLGYGFLERVYQNALYKELKRQGLKVEAQKEIKVFYKDEEVGLYFADMLVENKVILELKSAECIHPSHEAQLLNYLKATDIEVGLLLNFGLRPTFIRRVFSEYAKTNHLRKEKKE